MGNDSGIRQKSKQRTAPHKKHTVFPGMSLSDEVKVEYGSIKPISRPTHIAPQGSTKVIERPEIAWQSYDKASRDLHHADNVSASRSNNIERKYSLAYRQLVKAKLAPRIKRKYSKI